MKRITAANKSVSVYFPRSEDIKRFLDFLDKFAPKRYAVIPVLNLFCGDKEAVDIVQVSTPDPEVVPLYLRELVMSFRTEDSIFYVMGNKGFLLAAAGRSTRAA